MVWHYTVGKSFVSIVNDGNIKPATTYLPVGEKPVVWFTTEQFWESTVTKGLKLENGRILDLGMTALVERGEVLFRIGVAPNVAPLFWADIKAQSGMNPAVGRALARVCKQRGGNPGRWRGSFEPVTMSQWSAIEMFKKGRWVDCIEPSAKSVQSHGEPLGIEIACLSSGSVAAD